MFNSIPSEVGRQGRAAPPGPKRRLTPADVRRGTLGDALDYHRRGFCPIPQRPGEKAPCVRWMPFQEARPTLEVLESWFLRQFPDAGIALVLGPAFDLFVVDVDGEDAHRALVARLGAVPLAPMVRSGSARPFKYHLYLRHPDLATQAKYNPWHPQLEFRGHRGIVIAPPSLHKSGNRYAWADGKSLDDLPRPEVPAPILEALRAKAAQKARGVVAAAPKATPTSIPDRPESPLRERLGMTLRIARLDGAVGRNTVDFLRGVHADRPGWNAKLFRAACDLAGNDVPLDEALPLLQYGAAPWTAADREAAERTIRSAFAADRRPAREWAAGRRARPRITFTIPVRKLDAHDRGV